MATRKTTPKTAAPKAPAAPKASAEVSKLTKRVADLELELDVVQRQLKQAETNAVTANAGLSGQIAQLDKVLRDLSVTYQTTAIATNQELSRLDSADVAIQGELTNVQGNLGLQLTDVRSELDQ